MSDQLSQDELDAMLDATGGEASTDTGLKPEDLDTLGEIGNIAMGAASSTLTVTLSTDVNISTPEVTSYPALAEMPDPFPGEDKVLVVVQYTKGFSATLGLVMKATEAKAVADMMLGGTGTPAEPGPLTDIQVSALSEAMSQMMNAAATGLSSVLNQPVEINSPDVLVYDEENLQKAMPRLNKELVTVSTFQMTMGEQPPITLVQLLSQTDAKQQIAKLMSASQGIGGDGAQESDPYDDMMSAMDNFATQFEEATREGAAPSDPAANRSAAAVASPVTVQPVQFAPFDSNPPIYGEQNKNLDLVMDVSLNLTVELGKTELSIKEVLELTRGSVIELDRIAGEPVDLLANGKLIAKGEVVVIEDNFGLRITSIVSPADRLRGL